MRWMTKPWLLTLVVALTFVGCALPEGSSESPEGAYYLWVQGRQAGDIDACWNATHPDLRGYLARWHDAERETLFIVETIYPEGRRGASLEILEEGSRARLPDAKALFAHLLTREAGQPLAGLQALGARVSSSEVEGDMATITTVGGDQIIVMRDGEGWAVSLPEEQRQSLRTLVKKAEANLARARSNTKRLRGVAQPEQPVAPKGQ